MINISNVIYILTSIMLILIILRNISFYKFTFSENVLVTISILISSIFIGNFNKNLSTLPMYIIPIFFLYYKSKKLFKSILIQFTCFIIIILSDNLISYIMMQLFGINFAKSLYGYILICSLIFILAFFISKIISIFFYKYETILFQCPKSKYARLIYLMIFLTFGAFYLNINWNTPKEAIYLAKINSIIFLTYGVLMIIITFLLLFILKKDQNFKIKEVQMNNLKEYTNNLENLYMDMRKFRHDYINIISSMAGFIEDKNYEGLEKYFNEHIYPLNNQMNKNNYKLGLLKNILMPEIKGLLSAKIIRAQELGIDVVLEIVEPIDKINLDIIDLNRCLGIILDNAIEASLSSDEKKLNLAFIKKNSSIIIVVSNTFKGEISPLSKIFKSGFSTKGKDRGLGLSIFIDIMNKYSNATLDTYIEENVFTQSITIRN